jgi:hypothetical protein
MTVLEILQKRKELYEKDLRPSPHQKQSATLRPNGSVIP